MEMFSGMRLGLRQISEERKIKMTRRLLVVLILALLCFGLMPVSGCSNNAQTYGAVGGVGGVIIGGIAGGVGGAVIGGVVGGGGGYIIGNEQDKP